MKYYYWTFKLAQLVFSNYIEADIKYGKRQQQRGRNIAG